MSRGAKTGDPRAVLARLSAPEMELDEDRSRGGFALYRGPDRRRRAIARVSAAAARAWISDGVLEAIPARPGYRLTEAGRLAARRAKAGHDPFLAQHGEIIARMVMDEEGETRAARGFDPHVALKRIAALRDGDGRPFLSPLELKAATRLKQDWEIGLAGQVRGSDWSAPPRGGTARGPGDAQQAAMAKGCDARRRVDEMLARLAPPLRRVIERVCLREEGLEEMERGEGWPARSGKIALKLGLAQLALSGSQKV